MHGIQVCASAPWRARVSSVELSACACAYVYVFVYVHVYVYVYACVRVWVWVWEGVCVSRSASVRDCCAAGVWWRCLDYNQSILIPG